MRGRRSEARDLSGNPGRPGALWRLMRPDWQIRTEPRRVGYPMTASGGCRAGWWNEASRAGTSDLMAGASIRPNERVLVTRYSPRADTRPLTGTAVGRWFTHFMWLFLRLLRSAVVPAILRRMWRNRRRILAAVRR
jgi:hypothetical protein